ncbi:MAG: alpha/beta fold hydrolase [Lachnospiraceae bacterium]|uniref:Lysophospholipase n=1 Tax=Candidatus Weimeria bifida TaxID=2599074 RepID=A0A6N7J2D6_9FIRM|nr:lysophospholipase [Candidatus Weimeria bifida]RRF96576.1 MAG: alpha/beta fold hydrolase [Lachnospiraceae bacterium]
MLKENFSIQSKDDCATKLHCVEWRPDEGEPHAVMQLVHGMIEYIERYEEFAKYLTDRGFVVIGHDHIGHGHSLPKKSRSELGVMHTSAPEKTMCEDMFSVYKYGRKKYPDIPYFILGHSMGSYMLRRFLSVYSGAVDGLKGAVIVGTGTVPDRLIHTARLVIKTTALFHGWDYKSQTVTNILFSGDYHKFNMDGSEPEKSWLSKNVESVKKYYKDPYDTYLFSVNGYRGMTSAMLFDNSQENVNRIRKDLPILFASGADDPVGSMGKGVMAAYARFKKAGIKDLSIKLFENDRHEILQETDRADVYDFIYKWIQDRM